MRAAPKRPASPPWRGPIPLLLCLAVLAGSGPGSARAADTADDDTVLAVVRGGSAGSAPRLVTRDQFARAWAQTRPPVRPDSLTPAGARRFLDLLVGKEALGLMAAAGPAAEWTERDRLGYEALRDQLALAAALDSALAATRAALGPDAAGLDRQALGVAARERAAARLGVAWDDSLVARLAAAFAALPRPTADSSAAAQLRMLAALPAVALEDTGRALARSSAGGFRVADLLGAWARLSPVYRPRVATADDVRDLVANGLFERLLRRDAAARGLEARPDVAARLAAERERIAVSHLVAREVHGRVPVDSLTLLRFYREHEADWALPTRVRALTLVLEDRAEAGAMAARLRDAAVAESLAARARRAGSSWLEDVRADADSARFARLARAGTGTVLGPEETPAGWRVSRVLAVLPGRARTYDECQPEVLQRWYDEDGERRMQELLARARAAARVEVRAAALERLVAGGPGALRARR